MVLNSNLLYAETLCSEAGRIVPQSVTRVVQTVAEAEVAVAKCEPDILLTGVGVRDGDVLDFLCRCLAPARRIKSIFVVTTHREERVLSILAQLPIMGVFDPSSEGPERFRAALRAVCEGQPYWSASARERVARVDATARKEVTRLTRTEELVLTIIGDGRDDKSAAQVLRMSPATVQTIRRNIHRKLHIPHRGELVRLAVQLGYVRFTDTGVIRSGLSLMGDRSAHGPSADARTARGRDPLPSRLRDAFAP